MSDKLCWSLREAASQLGISQRLLWQLVRTNQIPHVRIGQGKRRLIRFPVDALQRWLQEKTKACFAGEADRTAISRKE